ncbi:MAG TPA: wax ester/triacylglycerol synthase family O-acyltransferase [Candidatus Dormibacteraeota bacterium]
MERLSPQDAAFIHLEDDNHPMHIGSVVVFEGPPPSYGDFVRLVASKLHLVPRYRQKVREVPLAAGRPVWVDDPHFTIVYHIKRTGLPSPGGDDELRNLAGRIFAQRLDRGKPLWELWIVEGLSDGRWALIAKTHHAVVDGVAGTELLALIFDLEPDGKKTAPPVPEPWTPRREPSHLELLADAALDTVSEPVAHLRGLPAVAASPLSSLQFAAELTAEAVRSLSRLARPAADGLNGPIGPHRRWSWARGSLEDIREIRKRFGGTVNDVVLAAITSGFRDLLRSRRAEVEGRVVRTLVPVSVRAEEERGQSNNRVSGYFVDLPVGVASPVERLELIREQMEGLKESKQAMAGDAITQLAGFAPPLLLALGARLGTLWPQQALNTVTTNVPGPQFALYACGRRMIEAYPYVPIGGRMRVTVAIFSYCGRLNFGVTGDYDTMTDLDVLVAGIETGLAELLRRARRPARRGRRSAVSA